MASRRHCCPVAIDCVLRVSPLWTQRLVHKVECAARSLKKYKDGSQKCPVFTLPKNPLNPCTIELDCPSVRHWDFVGALS